MDLVVGVDVHVVLVPSPAGPVPTPLPHPYLGMTGDPVGAAVSAAVAPLVSLCAGGSSEAAKGSVLVNGLPKMTTADLSRNVSLLPHAPMPPGTGFAKAPSGDGTHKLGSMTVTAGGASVVRLGELVMSCSDPVPLPTSTVVTLPKGPPVLAGGPSGINLAEAARSAVADRVFRTAWGAVGAAFKLAGRYGPRRLRTWLDSARCFFTGHPVDVATGCVVTDALDFELPGDLPLVFRRAYSSGWASRLGPLGSGWSHSLDRALWFEPDGVVVRLGDGRELVFDTSDHLKGVVPIRGEVQDRTSGYMLSRPAAFRWRVTSPDGIIDELVPIADDADPSAVALGICRVMRSKRRDGRNPIEFLYAAGRLAAVRDSHGRTVKLAYDAHGRLVRLETPDPDQPETWVDQMVFRYSEQGDLIEARDALGNATRYEYAGHLMTQETRRNGVAFHWSYDGLSSMARCLRTWGRNGDEVMFNQKLLYDPSSRRTVVLDSYGNATEYRTNEVNLVVQIRDPEGRTTTREYDDHLHLVAETDPLGNVTRTSYNRFGYPQITTAADGARTVHKYHPIFPELETLFCDECGGVWRKDYDGTGRLRALRGPEPGSRRELVWDDSRVVAVEEAGQRRTEIQYDHRGEVVALRNPAGTQSSCVRDHRGRIVRIVSPGGARTDIAYDLLDRAIRVRWPDGGVGERAYDPEGNLLEDRTPVGAVRFAYGNFDRLAWREQGGVRENFVWGQEGELREVRNARNQSWTFDYDRALRVMRETGFDLQRTKYKRDVAGRVVRKSVPGAVTEFAYDPVGRLVERRHGDGTWEKFEYRADGHLVVAENQDVKVTLERDALGRVTREQQGYHWVSTGYHLDEPALIESSLGARMATIRAVNGNLASVVLGKPFARPSEIHFSYDADGREIGREMPGGVSVRIDRDAMGRAHRQSAHDGQVESWSREYTWDHDHLVGIEDSHFGRSQFRYDATGAPVAADLGDQVQFRSRDAVGNVYRAGNMADRSFARGGRVRETPGESFGFISTGFLGTRTDSDGKRSSYRWNGAGMLAAVERPDGSTVAFTYDALGRRMTKRVGDVETRWIWAGNAVLHEVAGGETTTWYREPGGLTLLAQFSGDMRQHVITDHVGTPAVAYDDAGRSAWLMQLDLYGVPREAQSGSNEPIPCPWRWQGQYADGDVDLYYNRFRYYHPQLGGYISQDPIGVDGGLAPYAYVQDPLTWIDPFGLAGWVFDPTRDVDLTGGKGTYRDALDEAFRRTGIPREKFKASQWQRTIYGKSMPAQWHSASGAVVGVDDPSIVPSAHGPTVPHVGYQTPGKRRTGEGKRGHILVDAVPVTRSGLGCEK
jgi:RHS repeat-associated protein